MTNIFVFDLFNKKASNDSLIIVISSSNAIDLTKKITNNQNVIILEYDMTKIKEILKLKNIDHTKFVPMGHLLYVPNDKHKNVKSLLLGNIDKLPIANSFDFIEDFNNDYSIIRPKLKVNNDTYYSLGLHCHENIMSVISFPCVIPSELLTKIKLTYPLNDNLDATEFSLLSSSKIGFFSINRNKLLKKEYRNVKLLNDNDKYLTFVDSDVKTKPSNNSLQQSFSYNAQGELTTDGKCLTYNNNSVLVETCDKQHSNDNQKWLLTQNKILPSNDFGKCLEVSNNNPNVYLRECDDASKMQNWSTENTDSNSSDDYVWDKYQGKSVVLVENDNPWYVNTDTTIQQLHIKQPLNLRDDVKYKNNQDFESKFIMDPNNPSLGYGYSFSDRGGIPCSSIEGFGNISSLKNPTDVQIIFIILLLALIIFIYKCYIA